MSGISLIAIDDDKVLGPLRKGEVVRLPTVAINLKVMDDEGVFFVEVDREQMPDALVLLADKPVFDIAQGKPGDLLVCGEARFTVASPGLAMFTGEQRHRVRFEKPEHTVVRGSEAMVSFLSLGLVMLLAGWTFWDQYYTLDRLSQEEVTLPKELQVRDAAAQSAADHSFKRSQLRLAVEDDDGRAGTRAGQALEPGSALSFEKALAKALLGGHPTSGPQSADYDSFSGKVMPGTGVLKPEVLASERQRLAGQIRGQRSSWRSYAQAVAPRPSADSKALARISPEQLSRAQAGDYTALAALAQGFDSASLTLAQLGARPDLASFRDAWLSGLRSFSQELKEGKRSPEERRLGFGLLQRYPNLIPAELRQLDAAASANLRRQFDEALLLSDLDPKKSRQKLDALAPLVPPGHPLAEAIERALYQLGP